MGRGAEGGGFVSFKMDMLYKGRVLSKWNEIHGTSDFLFSKTNSPEREN